MADIRTIHNLAQFGKVKRSSRVFMTPTRARLRRIEFSNFKALSRYTLSISDVNILVGANNSGKSTIIGALRTLDAAIRLTASRSPERVYIGDTSYIGYRVPEDSVPISLENVQTDYNGEDAKIIFTLSNGNSLSLVFRRKGDACCSQQPKVS